MKAAVYTRYGPPDVLRVEDVPMPAAADGELLIRVRATTAASEDCTFRKGRPLISRAATGLTKPKHRILGSQLAGEVEAVGADGSRFSPGDPVYGATGEDFGAYAEYICLPADGALAPMPDGSSFADAAAVCAGSLTALPFLRDTGRLVAGEHILVNGASGSVGTAAVQLAKVLGAEVTGVCSTANVDLVRSLGADQVVDYTRNDFTDASGEYDIVFDAVGKSSFARCRKSLKAGGRYLSTVLGAGIIFQMLRTSIAGSRKASIAFTGLREVEEKAADLLYLNQLVESGRLRPVVDRHYPLDAIAEAHEYVDRGHKRGNVVIDV